MADWENGIFQQKNGKWQRFGKNDVLLYVTVGILGILLVFPKTLLPTEKRVNIGQISSAPIPSSGISQESSKSLSI